MKKYFILTIFIICTTLIALADDVRFINALKSCSSYSESGVVNTDGLNVTSNKRILGREGDKCVYQEKVNFSGIDSCITCRLSKSQIKELTSVMEAYNLVQHYAKDNIDTSSISNVQNNPVVKAWNKYLQDSSVCTLTTNQLK